MAKVAIDLEHDIQPVSDFRANASSVLAQLKETRRPVVLTQRGRGTAVLVDIQAYQALIEENETLRDIVEGLEDAQAGRVTSHADARRELLGRLKP